MEKIYIERLRKFASYLQEGKLVTPVNPIVSDPMVTEHSEYIQHEAPYFDFVIREMPFIFLSEWGFNDDATTYWYEDENKHPVSSTLYFFDISFDMFQHFFIPGAQRIDAFAGKLLAKKSSPQQIAHNIFELLKIVEEK